MKRFLLCWLLALSCAATRAQGRGESVSRELQVAFTAHCDTIDSRAVRYREAICHPDRAGAPALVIFLHGAGARGDDNLAPLGLPAVKAIHDYLTRTGIKARLLVPQCPESATWDGAAPGNQRRRDGTENRLEDNVPFVVSLRTLIGQYISRHGVDPGRIYISGASMGASGVWRLIADCPDLFAGALIASGAYRDDDYQALLSTPILCTGGTEEHPHDQIQRVVAKINALGGNADFRSLPGLRHVEACNRAFTDDNLDRLFSRTRPTPH